MLDKQELIVPSNNEICEKALNLFPYFIAYNLFMYLIVHVASSLPNIISHYVLNLIKKFLLAIIILVLIIYIIMYISFLMQDDKPLAVLDEKGISVRNFGFIPWEDINEFKIYSIGQGLETIGICLKDKVKRSSFKLRSAIFWSKISGYPPINIYNISTIPNSEIVWFAQQFLDQNAFL